MWHLNGAAPENPATCGSSADSGGPTRPLSVAEAIERIAEHHNVPKEVVQWEFWNAWDALVTDAKFLDYVLLLTEKRAMEALRHRWGLKATTA